MKFELLLKKLREEWNRGKPILLFDSEDREGEVDMMLPSTKVDIDYIATARKDAGGLICCAVSHEVAVHLGLPFITEVFSMASSKYESLSALLEHGLPYGARSSFSIYINHTNSFTGITDNDRSLTISEIGKLSARFATGNEVRGEFLRSFRVPGHVPMLRGAEKLLKSRLGHTELGLALCEMTGFEPSITMCEMMDKGIALSVEDAKAYAERNDLYYISGSEVIKEWVKFKGISAEEIFKPRRVPE